MFELLLLLTAIVTGANCFVISALKHRVKHLEAENDGLQDEVTELYGKAAEGKL